MKLSRYYHKYHTLKYCEGFTTISLKIKYYGQYQNTVLGAPPPIARMSIERAKWVPFTLGYRIISRTWKSTAFNICEY